MRLKIGKKIRAASFNSKVTSFYIKKRVWLLIIYPLVSGQPGRRQDSVTGRAQINLGGAREVYLCKFERGTEAREIYSSVNQTKKVKTKKRSSSQKFYEIRCESTKITKMRAVNPNLGVLGLNLHSNSPSLLTSSGHSPLLGGGHNFRLGGTSTHLGGTAPECPPVAPGLRTASTVNYWTTSTLFIGITTKCYKTNPY